MRNGCRRISEFWDDGIEWAIAGERAARLERERQLRASILACKKAEAANREKYCLIEQLHEANFRQAAKINSIVGARAEFADTLLRLFGYTMYTEEYENASIVGEVQAVIERANHAESELASLRASVGGKWIDVKQELPRSERLVLAHCEPTEWTTVCHWNSYQGYWQRGITKLDWVPTHWMLLPAPPTKDKE